MKFTLFLSDTVGDRKNILYIFRRQPEDAEGFRRALRMDHVCAEYQDCRRGNDNFLRSDCVVMDIDNDHSERPEDWITPEKVAESFPGVAHAVAGSRSHMKEKNGRSARPRLHVYFPIPETEDAQAYAALKRELYSCFPYFDGNALDAGRFIFGCETGFVRWNEGSMYVTELLARHRRRQQGARIPREADRHMPREPEERMIPEGQRNATMSRYAARLLMRYGNTEEARDAFRQKAAMCSPPLGPAELNVIWKSALRFLGKVSVRPDYVPPEEWNADAAGQAEERDAEEAAELKPEVYTHIGQARLIAAARGSSLAYTPGTGTLSYDGKRWEESDTKPLGLVMDFLGEQLCEAENAVGQAQARLIARGIPEATVRQGGKALVKALPPGSFMDHAALLEAKQYRDFALKSQDMRNVDRAMQALRPMVEVAQDALDAEPYLLNCPDGTYDLREGVEGKREHRSGDFITKRTAVSPGDKGAALWQETLETIFCRDMDLIAYVQKIAGLVAVGEVLQEALVIAYGEGSNGKSTFWNTIAAVLGDYSGAISADTLTAGCRRNVKPELAACRGKRLIIAAELEEGMRLSTSLIKQLTSTDPIAAEQKYKDPFSFKPTHTVVLYTNHLPKVGAMDRGTWRRLIVVPFNAVLSGDGKIRNYANYLEEEAGPAVLKWVMEGARLVIRDGKKPEMPEAVREATAQYRESNDWMSQFLEDCCEVGAGMTQPSGTLYTEYRMHCTRNGEFARSTAEFYTALEQRGMQLYRNKSGRYVIGLKLKEKELDF